MRKKLIILEMANNHNGSVNHGLNIIRTYNKITKSHMGKYEFCFKFQLRSLDTFIRPDMAGNLSVPLVKRFEETRISIEELKEMVDEAKACGFSTMITPFDELSAERLDELRVDYAKIASCSFNDWSLLEKIAKINKPVVASCAGASESEIDKVIDFFSNRDIYILLQHCIGEYPTAEERMNIAQVGYLRKRYPSIDIGFSSHEDPSSVDLAPLAYAQGAVSFEKHVALPNEHYGKNAYSTSPDQFEDWLKAIVRTESIMGAKEKRYEPTKEETKALQALKRGIFAKRKINIGETISIDDVYFAFPPSDSQLLAEDLGKHIELTACKELGKDEPLTTTSTTRKNNSDIVLKAAKGIMTILKEARIGMPRYADLEISHHYGIDKFEDTGLGMVTVVNRQYCKKILIMIAGQSHPEQYHKIKEETFHVLWGEGEIFLNGKCQKLQTGMVLTIEPYTRHMFRTDTGIVIEEISTNHEVDDSFYTDESIQENKHRKTFLAHWDLEKE
jgi:sialic acid synthase SpsE/mannose-6-phosphate isomerase-like protein (cupin superfamily)